MSTLERIRDAFNRMVHVYGKRPALARFAATTRCRIVDGPRCETDEDGWRLVVDMPVDAGGAGEGPTPGVYGRAALASCLAIGYSMHLARAGIAVRSLEVDVEAEGDHRGLVGVADVNPAYSAVRHTLYLDCDATPEQLRPLLAQAERCSPYLHVWTEPQPVTGQVVFGPRPQG